MGVSHCSKPKPGQKLFKGRRTKKKPKTPNSKHQRPNQNLGAAHDCHAHASARVFQTKNKHGRPQKNSFEVRLVSFNPWHTAHPPRSPLAHSATSPEELATAKEYIGHIATTAKKQMLQAKLNQSPTSNRTMQDMANMVRVIQQQEAKEHTGGSPTSTTTTAALLAPLLADPERAFVAVIKFGDGQLSTLIKRAGTTDTAFVPGEPFVKSTAGQSCDAVYFRVFGAAAVCTWNNVLSLRSPLARRHDVDCWLRDMRWCRGVCMRKLRRRRQ